MLEKMRRCRLNFAEHRYDCEAGIVGEHNATELIITPPAIMPDEAVYRLCFEPGGVSEILSKRSDGTLAYPLPAAVTATAFCCMTLIGYIGNEQVYKSRMVQLHFCRAADGDTGIDPQQPGIVAEVNRNTAARHTHDNKLVIDLLTADDTGVLMYDGKAIGGSGGASTAEEISYTLLPDLIEDERIKDAIFQEDAKNVQGIIDQLVYFSIYGLFADNISCTFDLGDGSEFTTDLQNVVTNLMVPTIQKSHEHTNKFVLDAFSDSNGSLQYNSKPITVQKISEGSNITLSDNTEYRLTNVSTLTLTYPAGDFESWMRLTFAASGNITVTLPAETKYIGAAPDFKNGETWELSFKDKVLAAQKVGEGT